MTRNPVNIGSQFIGPDQPCIVIAEAGINHNGSLQRALELVEVAKTAKVDAVKFQLYRIEEQISQYAPTAKYQNANTRSDNMFEMAKSYDLPWEAHHKIAAKCAEVGILYMASCFDSQAIDFLLSLGGQCIKIASGEITNYPLLAYASNTGKSILLSTGMSSIEDIRGAVKHIQANGNSPLALFHCVSSYPANPEEINLHVMRTLSEEFDVPVGFSDHTEGNTIACAAIALGACMIEKHFTTDKSLPGPDHSMSLNPTELQKFVSTIRDVKSSLGTGVKQIERAELDTQKVARRSLVSLREISIGEKLDDNNITLKRPATGIDPRQWESALGRKAKVAIPEDVPITWDMLE